MASNFGEKIFSDFNGSNVPDDFEFPSMEIEDIDRAVFDLFDKVISFEVLEKGKSRKVPVVFAAGERFALTRRKQSIRDKNNTLILPLISILRGEIDVSPSQHNYGTAISYADQPNYYIKKRLSKKDRKYQNLINKQKIKNQDNVAAHNNFADETNFPGGQAVVGKVASRRNKGNNSVFSKQNIDLSDNITDNIFEIIDSCNSIKLSSSYKFWQSIICSVILFISWIDFALLNDLL